MLANRIVGRLKRDAWTLYKEGLRLAENTNGEQPTTVFVQGCQRSGTSMMTRIFERDRRTRIFWETPVFARDYHYPSFDIVEEHFYKRNAKFVVAKPLIDMHKLPSLLAYFKGKAVWMVRNYRDVVASNIARFGEGNGYETIKPIVENDLSDWKAVGISYSTRTKIANLSESGISDFDAAALFWYARNDLFFHMKMHKHPFVTLCKYEDLVSQPRVVVGKLYEFIGLEYPGDRVIAEVRGSSVGKGAGMLLSPEVDELCRGMADKLEEYYQETPIAHHALEGNQ